MAIAFFVLGVKLGIGDWVEKGSGKKRNCKFLLSWGFVCIIGGL